MGKQFGFIMDEGDEKEFLKIILNSGKVFQDKKKEGVEQIFSLPESIWLKLYLTKDEFGELKLLNTKDDIQYIDSMKSSVIEFRETIPRIKINEIQRGRLYLDNKYYDDGQLVQKEENLDKWYKELVRWIKKRLKCVEIYSNGRAVKEYVSVSLAKYVEDGFNLLG